MNIFFQEGSFDTPRIELNARENKFSISGRSLPEDTFTFYQPVINWIIDYINKPNPTTEFEVKLEYFNTATSKVLLDIFLKLEKVKNAKIVWYSLDDDEDMAEAGQEFSEMVNIPFSFELYQT